MFNNTMGMKHKQTCKPGQGLHIVFVIMLLGLILTTCSDPYNPSFKNLLQTSEEDIKTPSPGSGSGTFEWNISFPDGKAVPSKSFLQLAVEAGGSDILNLEDSWLGSGLAQGTQDLPLGTYFLRFRLANELSYITIAQIITIRRGVTTKFEHSYTEAEFKPFVKFGINLQVSSLSPVTPVRAQVTFYDNASCAGEPLSKPGWTPDIRELPVSQLNTAYYSEGWTALPFAEGSSTAPFYAKIVVTDNKGREFIRIRPYETAGQIFQLEIGTPADTLSEPLLLLYPITIDPSITGGTFHFGSKGTDGKYYGPSYGYRGAEPDTTVIVFDQPLSGTGINRITVTTDPPLSSEANKLSEKNDDTLGNYFEFTQPLRSNNPAFITGEFSPVPQIIRLGIVNNDVFDTVVFGYRESLQQAIDDAKINTDQYITLLGDFNAEQGGAFTGSAATASVTIPSTKKITLLTENGAPVTITRIPGYTATLFNIAGELTLSASAEAGLTFDGANNGATNPVFTMVSAAKLKMGNHVQIKNNSSGGAVSISSSYLCRFEMSGGSIENCSTSVYGAVHINGSVITGGTFEMSGGSIRDNNTGTRIAVKYVGGSFQISGSAKIEPGNVVSIPTGPASQYIEITGNLSNEAVAVIMPTQYIEGAQVVACMSGAEPANLAKFSIQPEDDSGISKPWELIPSPTDANAAELYGPEAKIIASGTYTYKGRLNTIADSDIASANTEIQLLKNINVTAAGDYWTLNLPGKHVKLTGPSPVPSPAKTIFRKAAATGSLIVLNAGDIVLENIILDGGATWSGVTTPTNSGISADSALVQVNGGMFGMASGSKIQNHQNASTNGGGAYINSGAVFTVSGNGTISATAANSGAIVYNKGELKLSGTPWLSGYNLNDIYTEQPITIGSTLSSMPPVKINPQSYPTTNSVQILKREGSAGTSIATAKAWFPVIPQQVVGAAARTWEIDDEGYLYFGLTITCTLPRDVPGINFSLSHGTIRKGTPLTITLPATMLSDLSDLGRQIDSTQVLLDGGQIYSGTGPTSPSCTINDDAGQYTVTVILNTSKTGASDPISYSGDFQLTVQQ